MATWAAPSQTIPRRFLRTRSEQPDVSRGRKRLAATLEISLDPQLAMRRRLLHWPHIPWANRVAMAEAMEEIVLLLRNPAVAISEDALQRILALATHPESPAFGRYPNRARFAAWALADELRGGVLEAGETA
jgi:hypothetical protein